MRTIIFQIRGKVLRLEVQEENLKTAGSLQSEYKFKGDTSWLHGCLIGLEQNKELVTAVLKWWEEHQYDTFSDGEEEYNTYDAEPEFVTIAKRMNETT